MANRGRDHDDSRSAGQYLESLVVDGDADPVDSERRDIRERWIVALRELERPKPLQSIFQSSPHFECVVVCEFLQVDILSRSAEHMDVDGIGSVVSPLRSRAGSSDGVASVRWSISTPSMVRANSAPSESFSSARSRCRSETRIDSKASIDALTLVRSAASTGGAPRENLRKPGLPRHTFWQLVRNRFGLTNNGRQLHALHRGAKLVKPVGRGPLGWLHIELLLPSIPSEDSTRGPVRQTDHLIAEALTGTASRLGQLELLAEQPVERRLHIARLITSYLIVLSPTRRSVEPRSGSRIGDVYRRCRDRFNVCR